MMKLKDKLKEIEIETCYQSFQEYLPRLLAIAKSLKENKDNNSLRNLVFTIEDLVLGNGKAPVILEKEESLSPEIINKIRSGTYNHRDFILDVYHSGIDKKLLYNEFKKINKPSSYGSIEAWATMKLDKYEKQAQETGEPIEIKANGRKVYVDCRRGIHLDQEEAVEANKGYLEEMLNVVGDRTGPLKTMGQETRRE